MPTPRAHERSSVAPTTKTINAALYLRISSDPSGERAGVERQEDECRLLAASLGWDAAEVYIDNDVSAYNGKRRPDYERMIEDVRSGRVNAVISWHSDRLYRRIKDLTELIELTKDHPIEIATVSGGSIDLSSPTGRAVATTICTWAGEFESAHKAERVAAAAHARAMRGRIHGTRSFGYTATTEIVPDEADAIRQAVAMVIAGSSLRSVGFYLDSKGITTLGGRRWSESLSMLRRVLISFKVAGIPSYKGTVLNDVTAQWPSIISRADHEKVLAILTDGKRRTNGHVTRARKALLSGLATCGACGGPMRSATKEASRLNKARMPVYRCHHGNHTTLRQHILE